MVCLDAAALADLLRQAEASPRLRSHLLLHGGHDDPVQRLVIALRRGTYIRPHVQSVQWEMLTLLRGAADVLFFDSSGRIVVRTPLSQAGTTVIQIPQGQVHSAVAIEHATVIVEVKPGPFRVNEFMDWAPPEGGTDAQAFVQWVEHAAIGARFRAD
jgi:cupin fold WbuC family metalloprotein